MEVRIFPQKGETFPPKQVKIPTYTHKFTFVKEFGYNEDGFMSTAVLNNCSLFWAFLRKASISIWATYMNSIESSRGRG